MTYFCGMYPVERYGAFIEGQHVGLYPSYLMRPALLNLIMCCTILPFDYEEGTELPPGKRSSRLPNDGPYEATLEQEVAGENLKTVFESWTPVDIRDLLCNQRIDHLEMVKFMASESQKQVTDSVEAVRYVLKVRSTIWAKHFRGRLKTKDNVIQTVFNGLKVSKEDWKRVEFFRGAVKGIQRQHLMKLGIHHDE